MQIRFIVLGLVLAAAIIGGVSYWRSAETAVEPPVAAQPVARKPAPVPEPPSPGPATPVAPAPAVALEPAEPVVVLPELNASDSWLRTELVGAAIPWLAETELIRTFASVLDNASRGDYPRNLLGFMAPSGKFEVRVSGNNTVPTPASYARYDAYAAALASVSPDRAADLFVTMDPLLSEALRELGIDDPQPLKLLAAAAAHVDGIPEQGSTPALARPKVMYTFADPELEGLLPLQKQLLRMGPENLAVVRDWLNRFLAALG